jgi:prohibitin 1
MNRLLIIGGAVAAAFIFVFVFVIHFSTVGTGYRGVQLSWQKPTGLILGEGFYFFSPMFGQSIVDMNVQTVADEIKASAASRDLQSVNTTVTVNYHLDPGKVVSVYDQLRQDYEARIVNPTVQEAVKAAVGQFNAPNLIENRSRVRDSIDRDLRTRVAKYGIVVDQVLITDFSFDPTFQQAVEAKVAAQQDLLTATINAQKAKAVAIGQAQAQQAQRQTLTPILLEKQLLDKWDGKLPVYYIAGGGGTSNPFGMLKMVGGSVEP